MLKIIAIFRGTLLLAYPHIDHNELGQFFFDLNPEPEAIGRNWWWINNYGSENGDSLDTMLMGSGGPAGMQVIFTDPLTSAGR